MMSNDKLIKDLNKEDSVGHVIALSFVIGTIVGIVLASFLHKYIVHPLGW